MGLLSRLFGPPDRKAFANQVARAIRAGGVTDKIDYDAAEFSLQIGGADRHTINLSNAYAEYARAARRDRLTIVQKYASLTQIGPGSKDNFASARPNLLPRVQSRAYHEQLRRVSAGLPAAGAAARPDRFEHRAFTEDLALDLVCDFPQAIRTVTARDLEDWGVSFDDALGIAKDNLWRRSNEPWEVLASGLHLSPWRDTHDASRLFLHDLVWQLPVKGDPVAIAPNRAMLFVTGSDDVEGLRALAAVATEAMTVDRPVSGVAVKLTGTRWSSWLPAPDHPAHHPLKNLALRSRAIDYEEQKRALDAANKKAGRDQFVAKFAIRQREDGSYLTYASWTGVTDGAIQQDTLLPEAEWIGLVQHASKPEGPKVLGFVRLDELKHVAADVLLPTDHYPPRYHARAFLTPEQLARLRMRPQPQDP